MPSHYSPADRQRAAAAVLAHGTSKAAGKAAGIPASTIRHWRHNDADFGQLCAEAQAEFSEQMQAQLTQIIDLAQSATIDRLTHGNVVLDGKTGEQVRVPINGKDCAIIGAVAIDKLRLVQGQPTKIVADAGSLAALAAQFAALGRESRGQVVAVQGQEKQSALSDS